MVIEPCFFIDSHGIKYIYVETNTMEIAGYQADETQSELYKVTVGLHSQLELGDQAVAEQ